MTSAKKVAKKLGESPLSDVDAYRVRAMKRIANAIVSFQVGLAEEKECDGADWQTRGPQLARDLRRALFELEYMGEELLRHPAAEERTKGASAGQVNAQGGVA